MHQATRCMPACAPAAYKTSARLMCTRQVKAQSNNTCWRNSESHQINQFELTIRTHQIADQRLHGDTLLEAFVLNCLQGVCEDMFTPRRLQEGFARNCMHRGVCTKMVARRCLHGCVCTEVLAQRCLHRGACKEAPASRCSHGNACTEMFVRRLLHGGAASTRCLPAWW